MNELSEFELKVHEILRDTYLPDGVDVWINHQINNRRKTEDEVIALATYLASDAW